MELPAADDRDPPGGGRGRTSREKLAAIIFTERFLIAPPAAARARSRTRRAAGAADRRARPHRRAVRGLPARGAVRLPDHDPGARPIKAERAADRRHHVEPHARDPRRDQAPLPLPLGRLSGRRARARDRARARRRSATPALSREVVAFVQRAARVDLFKLPGVAETIDWAQALVALDRSRSTRDRRRHPGRAAQVPGRHRARSPARKPRAWCRGEVRRRARASDAAAAAARDPPRAASLPRTSCISRACCAAPACRSAPTARLLALEALAVAGIDPRARLVAATLSRLLLVVASEQRPIFDQAFELFWRDPKLPRR